MWCDCAPTISSNSGSVAALHESVHDPLQTNAVSGCCDALAPFGGLLDSLVSRLSSQAIRLQYCAIAPVVCSGARQRPSPPESCGPQWGGGGEPHRAFSPPMGRAAIFGGCDVYARGGAALSGVTPPPGSDRSRAERELSDQDPIRHMPTNIVFTLARLAELRCC